MLRFEPKRIAVDFYFGDLQYWKLPRVAADALEQGLDGPALRILAGIANPIAADMNWDQVDSAFREMGVDAPISKDHARLILAEESVSRALNGASNVFDEATYIRIHLCEFKHPTPELRRIYDLSCEARSAPRSRWNQLEQDLTRAFRDFLADPERSR